MSKITRDKLARGAKLLIEHIFSPLQSAQTQITQADIEQEQLEANYAPFRINWSVPHWGTSFGNGTNAADSLAPLLAIPFMLPPLEDTLSYAADARGAKVLTVSDDTPAIILDEVSVSFDQRGEPAAIISNWAEGAASQGASANKGDFSYERTSNLDLQFAILEKTPVWINPTGYNFAPSRAVWSGSLSGALDVNDGYFRLNPWVASSIREVMDPFKSYVFVVTAPTVSDTKWCEFVSLEISLRFLTPLIDRNQSATIQNLPYRHRGAKNALAAHTVTGAGTRSATPRPLITAVPAAGAAIEANTATGAQTSMAVIDEFMRRKLQGGYTMDSNVPMLEELEDSASYTVLAVPLFNNTRYGGVSTSDYYVNATDHEPYIVANTGKLIDRRYIPIVAPMTIHHVLYSWNWFKFTRPTGGAGVQSVRNTPNASDQLTLEVGVGIGTGARADNYDYEQVASDTIHTPVGAGPAFAPSSWYGHAIDMWAIGSPTGLPFMGASTILKPFNLELHSMNLVGTGFPGLNGMTAQGRPYFVGRSRTSTSSRTGLTAGGSAATAGAEQWLEVRARISDGSGASNMSAYGANLLVSGAGGMWVYIIGKTNLV